MKYIKYQQDLISNFLKNNIKRMKILENENEVIFMEDYKIIVIPKTILLLDIEKLKESFSTGVFDLSSFFKIEDSVPANLSGLQMKNDKDICLELVTEDGKKTFIKEKLLKYFENPTFKFQSELKPIGIFEDQNLVGVVCPIKIKGTVNHGS